MKKQICSLAKNYSMISEIRINNFLSSIDYIIANNINGCIVECGVWKGGAICSAKRYIKNLNINKNVYAFDSFEGLPIPDDNTDFLLSTNQKASQICNTKNDINNNCYCNVDTFKKTMRAFNLDDNDIIIKKGWFENTCVNFNENISILRFDGDWYKSTNDVLNNLYDKITPGGVIIFDDYGYWNGNKKAVDEFLILKNIKPTLNFIDKTEMWFIKP